MSCVAQIYLSKICPMVLRWKYGNYINVWPSGFCQQKMPEGDSKAGGGKKGRVPSCQHCTLAEFRLAVVVMTFVLHSQNHTHHAQLKDQPQPGRRTHSHPLHLSNKIWLPALWGLFSDFWGTPSTVAALWSGSRSQLCWIYFPRF